MKSFTTLSSLFICLSLSLLADPTVTPPPTQPAYTDRVSSQPKGTITPTVSPLVHNGLELVIDGDFLWWKSQVSGMSFAIVNEKTKSPPTHFEPGLKIGFGIDLDFDGWDIYGEYTWINQPWSKNSFTAGKGSSSGLIYASTPSGTLLSPVLTSGTSSRKEQFNIIDLELGRNFFISRKLTLRPHFGIKLARMFEKTKISEHGSGDITQASMFFQQTLSGIGSRAGIDTVWHLTQHLGLYGDIALTALWSSFHNNADTHIAKDSITTHSHSKGRNQTILPVLEFGLGVTYMFWFHNDRFQLYSKAGWEEQIWVDYNRNAINGTLNNTGILSLQGLSAKVGLAF